MGVCQGSATIRRQILMPTYEVGDFVKAEFTEDSAGEPECMWILVDSCDDANRLVFGESQAP